MGIIDSSRLQLINAAFTGEDIGAAAAVSAYIVHVRLPSLSTRITNQQLKKGREGGGGKTRGFSPHFVFIRGPNGSGLRENMAQK